MNSTVFSSSRYVISTSASLRSAIWPSGLAQRLWRWWGSTMIASSASSSLSRFKPSSERFFRRYGGDHQTLISGFLYLFQRAGDGFVESD